MDLKYFHISSLLVRHSETYLILILAFWF